MVSYMKRAIEIKNVIYSLFKRKIEIYKEKNKEKSERKARGRKGRLSKFSTIFGTTFFTFRQFLERLFSHDADELFSDVFDAKRNTSARD